MAGEGSKAAQTTIGLIIVVISMIYIYERLKFQHLTDVFLAVLIFGGALIYMYAQWK